MPSMAVMVRNPAIHADKPMPGKPITHASQFDYTGYTTTTVGSQLSCQTHDTKPMVFTCADCCAVSVNGSHYPHCRFNYTHAHKS